MSVDERKMTKPTKRKVNLTSSHSNNERDEGPLAAHSLEGSAVSELYERERERSGIPEFLRYHPRNGETVVYEEIYIPDVD